MKEITGDIWDYHGWGYWIVITTNGSLNTKGEAMMGKGIALQAKLKFPRITKWLGINLTNKGNQLFVNHPFRIITFPTKDNWKERAKLSLIATSCKELVEACKGTTDEVYMIRPGCGNGQLDWKDVKPILEEYLDNRFVVVERS